MKTLKATRATLIGLALLATPLGGETHPQEQVPSLAVLATPGQLPDRRRMGVSPAAVDEARKKSAIDAYGSLPLGFEPNRGQFLQPQGAGGKEAPRTLAGLARACIPAIHAASPKASVNSTRR